jgi:ribose transport system permease protein
MSNINGSIQVKVKTSIVPMWVSKVFKIRELDVLVALVVISALITMATPYFLTVDNIMDVFRSSSLTAMMAIGMVLVIVTGGIDLSVGSVLGLSSLVVALSFQAGLSMPVAIGCGVLLGVVFGAVNGLLVTVVGLQPFIATLGTLSIGRGVIYMITRGMPLSPHTPPSFAFLGQGYISFVPVPVCILVVLLIIFGVITRRSRFGRYIYAIGGNEQACRFSGVRTGRIKFYVYVLSGLISGCAGILSFSRYLTSEPSAGFGNELNVIAAAAIGGASLAGGIGSVEGAVIGAALTGIIANGVVLMNINTYAQSAITGCVILIAVGVDVVRNRRRGA